MADIRPRPKLWEEMTPEEKRELPLSWQKHAAQYYGELMNRFWKQQESLKILRDRPGTKVVPVRDTPEAAVSSTSLPQDKGHYLWYILDFSYLKVGMVHVTHDSEKQLAYLQKKYEEGCRSFLIYQNQNGETLTLYHEAHDHQPPCNKDGVPWVDGYVPISLDLFK